MTPERMDEIREYLERCVGDDRDVMIKDLVYALDAAHHAHAMDEAKHMGWLEAAHRKLQVAEHDLKAMRGGILSMGSDDATRAGTAD